MSRLLAALSGILLACGPHASLPMVVSYHGSDHGWEVVQAAVKDWNQACDGTLVIAERGGNAGVSIDEVSALDSCKPDDKGCTHHDAFGQASIQFLESTPLAEDVVTHEMGHALGLSHVGYPDIMFPTISSGNVQAKIHPEDCAHVRLKNQ